MFKRNLDRGDFSKTDERMLRELRELRALPDIEARISSAEQQNVAKRTKLKQQLDTLSERHDPALEAAAAKCTEAANKIEVLRAQIRDAEEAHRATVAATWHLESLKNRDEFDARRELYDGRDPRLDQYLVHLGTALSLVGHCTKLWIQHEGHNWLGKLVHRTMSNQDEVVTAMNLLKKARKQVEGLALEPLTRTEISGRLTSITGDVAPTLKKFSIGWPALDKDGEVELQSPHANALEVLRKNGVATAGDLSPDVLASKIRKAEIDALDTGGAVTVGDMVVGRRRR
ncbi:hypothetical protein [Burkholderia sp. Ac-20353]|uniref:hypothetical protein n=1 Tax=Burkholderia sp. Ac-20353 TaxID=2703894 RepID=UPI00197C4375|nr:hypothetical protein [Burkholderia sp. Ac-20353]MBN3789712.1 hypothetical protein [Burkholderia sp. Ac-20353]